MKLVVDPENRDKFNAACSIVTQVVNGSLGLGGQAYMMTKIGLDREIFGAVSKSKRIRRKRMKKLLRRVMLETLVDAGLRAI